MPTFGLDDFLVIWSQHYTWTIKITVWAGESMEMTFLCPRVFKEKIVINYSLLLSLSILKRFFLSPSAKRTRLIRLCLLFSVFFFFPSSVYDEIKT